MAVTTPEKAFQRLPWTVLEATSLPNLFGMAHQLQWRARKIFSEPSVVHCCFLPENPQVLGTRVATQTNVVQFWDTLFAKENQKKSRCQTGTTVLPRDQGAGWLRRNRNSAVVRSGASPMYSLGCLICLPNRANKWRTRRAATAPFSGGHLVAKQTTAGCAAVLMLLMLHHHQSLSGN